MTGPTEPAGMSDLHRAAWPDLFADLQEAYAELTRAKLALERRTAETEEIRDLLERVVGAMSEALFLLDARGHVQTANAAAARLAGLPAADLTGRPFREVLVAPEIPATAWELLERAPDGSLGYVDATVSRRDGSSVPVSTSCSVVRDTRGKITGVLVVLRDITGRRNLERELRERAEELVEADRSKDEFLAMLAHELRNPLTPILNAAALLRLRRPGREEPPDDRVEDVIERQVGHMARLLDDLLDVARVTRGKVTLRRERVELATLVESAVASALSLVESKNHHLSVDLPDEAVELDADPTRIEQVLVNLLNNAAKYTEPGGEIELTARRVGEEVEVRIRDTGVGMDEETLQQVFDLFVQHDRSLDRSHGGLGIGLTLVESLVQRHGGTVRAESPGPGRGSTFLVRLPALPGEARPSGGEESREPRGTGASHRILVVDDNRDAAESLATLVEAWGHEVEVAYDGPSALEAAERLDPHAIVLDLGLPGLDGYAVAERLRREGSRAFLLALSGYGDDEARRRCREVGFDDHLLKPVKLPRLRALIEARADPGAEG